MSTSLTILLAEDSENDALLIERALRRAGWVGACTRVDAVATLEAALARQAWDVILSDYQLPGFTGLEVLERVQASGLDCPFIIVSGTIGEETAVAAMRAGAHDYVLKDDLARLGPALRRELREAENRRERRAAAEALRVSEARLRFVTGHMLDLISEIDVAGGLRYVSPSHRTILGYDPAELIGRSVFDFIHPDDLAPMATVLQAATRQPQPTSVACRFRHAAGHYLWLESSANPVVDPAGQLLSAILSSRDVTARRLAELAEREQRVLAEALGDTAAALNSSLDLPVVLERVLDNVGRVVPHDAAMILLINGQAVHVAAQRGFARRDAAGQLSGLRLSLVEVPSVAAILETGQATVLVGHPQCLNPALHAVIAWAQSCAGAPLRYRDQIIGLISLHGARPDAFTERQAASLQVFADQAAIAIINARLFESERQRVAELQRSNAFTTALAQVAARLPSTNDLTQVVQTLGAELRALGLACCVGLRVPGEAAVVIRSTSLSQEQLAAVERLTGVAVVGLRLTPENFAGFHLHLGQSRPERLLDVQALVSETLPLGLPQPLLQQALDLIGASSADSVAILPMTVDENLLGLLAIWGPGLRPADLSALSVFASQVGAALQTAELVAHLEDARRAAETANQLKSLFLANVSHELRTPLTGVLGALDLVLGEVVETPTEKRQFLGMAREAGQRLLKLINDLLDLARIEAGHLHAEFQAVDLAPVVAEACILCRPAADAKQLPLRVILPVTEPLQVRADPDRLMQIVLNLVGNAIKFTERGEVRVVATADPGTGEAEIRVEDTGIGIPPDLQAQLFRPFVQADSTSTRKYGGTGLGLAISRRLTELMRGSLSLHSAGVGMGSTFVVRLPLADGRALTPPDAGGPRQADL